MHEILLTLHILGLMFGAAGGIASGLVARRAASLPPEQAAPLRALGPLLSRLSLLGLALLWLSGLGLVALFGGPANLPSMFWLKALFILSLTCAALAIEWTYARIKAGAVGAAARLPLLGPIAGVSAMLAMATAVFAFH